MNLCCQLKYYIREVYNCTHSSATTPGSSLWDSSSLDVAVLFSSSRMWMMATASASSAFSLVRASWRSAFSLVSVASGSERPSAELVSPLCSDNSGCSGSYERWKTCFWLHLCWNCAAFRKLVQYLLQLIYKKMHQIHFWKISIPC